MLLSSNLIIVSIKQRYIVQISVALSSLLPFLLMF